MSDPTEFSLASIRSPRWDQGTFMGRLKHNLEIIDPSTLLNTEADIMRQVALLDAFAEGRGPPEWLAAQLVKGDAADGHLDDPANAWRRPEAQRALWKARKVVNAAVHPDTGKIIPAPFRMSGYVPFGTPVVVAMLIENQHPVLNAVWQWVNVTHNACVNSFNANASTETPASEIAVAYAGAVTGAISVVTALNWAVGRAKERVAQLPATHPRLSLLRGLVGACGVVVPYLAVAAANVVNVRLMRGGELRSGIAVRDGVTGEELGLSRAAAAKAVRETALSRVVLPAPILLLPPVGMRILRGTPVLRGRGKVAALAVNAALCTASFAGALPVALSLFRQSAELPRDQVEPEIAARMKGTHVVFNKGL